MPFKYSANRIGSSKTNNKMTITSMQDVCQYRQHSIHRRCGMSASESTLHQVTICKRKNSIGQITIFNTSMFVAG